MYYGELSGANGRLIDLCLCMVSRGPESYTGEDTAEFHCHGSPIVLTEVLQALFSLGVRQADAGEFTKRAFLNGRMDLTQAEAVIDLIEAETLDAALNAAGQLRGAIREKLESVYSTLLEMTAHFHAVIDYPDEDIDEFDMQKYLATLKNTENELALMLASYGRGAVLRGGVPTAIIGRPNTGKSSLLNALLGYDRAIVTDIAGTTRDTIEEKALIGGVLLRLIDTAGLRRDGDVIEKFGVDRMLAALKSAKLVLLVLDGSAPLQEGDYDALRSIPADALKLAVVNKSDMPHVLDTAVLPELGFPFCRVSAYTGDGIGSLEAMVKGILPETGTPPAGEIITNARHAGAIKRAKACVVEAAKAISESITPDAALFEVESALLAIGEITGKTMREDLVSTIFERFCVGK